MLDKSKTYEIGFSGGKDSVATWLYLTRRLGLPNVRCQFLDTGHEAGALYNYLDILERDHGLNLVRTTPTLEDFRPDLTEEKIRQRLNIPADRELSEIPVDMERLAILKRRFPSPMARFCTEILKLRPRRRWLRSEYGDDISGVILCSGVRAQESAARAAKPDWFFDDYMGAQFWLPIHKWKHEDVFAIHRQYDVPPNPLYLRGSSRVGCYPCIMARKPELRAMPRKAFDDLRSMEIRVCDAVNAQPETDTPVLTMSFFTNDICPPRYRSHLDAKTGKRFPDAIDVRDWACGDPGKSEGSFGWFEEDWTEDAASCQSVYGLCE